MNNKTKAIAYGGIIAALYVVLTVITSFFGLANGAIQLRLSEALNVLAVFTPVAVPGLFIGCLVSNILTGCIALDIIFGSIATLIGAVGIRLLRKHRILALLCPVVSNAVIVPLVLKYGYGIPGSVWYFALTVGIGQILSCTVLGFFFGKLIDKSGKRMFK